MMNNKHKVLIVEDDENIRMLVGTLLENEGYKVIEAGDFATAKTMYSSYVPDLIILDLGLPDADGSEFLSFVRDASSVPVIILSARSDEHDKVAALDIGANDYITKPFGSAELLARVRAALRNRRQTNNANADFKLKDLLINYDARRVFIKDKEIKLTQTEYNIVAFLSEHCGKVMTYSAIIKAIWGYPDEGSTKKLQVNMANIRKKFGAIPGEKNYITNELGVGYRMDYDSE